MLFVEPSYPDQVLGTDVGLLLLVLMVMMWSRALDVMFSHSNPAAIHTISSLAQNSFSY